MADKTLCTIYRRQSQRFHTQRREDYPTADSTAYNDNGSKPHISERKKEIPSTEGKVKDIGAHVGYTDL